MKNTRRLLLPLLLTGLLAPGVAAPSVATARTGGAPPAMSPAAVSRPAADDIRARIAAVPGMRVVKENPAPAGYRSFALAYRQPVDHRHPGKGSFEQRLSLLHRSTARPMVLHTNGYDLTYQDPAFPAQHRGAGAPVPSPGTRRGAAPASLRPATTAARRLWQTATVLSFAMIIGSRRAGPQ